MILADLSYLASGAHQRFDHYLCTEYLSRPRHVPKHSASLSMFTLLKGTAKVSINENRIELDDTSFIIVNDGSIMSIDFETGGELPVLILFNPSLSAMLSSSMFQQVSMVDEFALVEHVHYSNVDLKRYLHLLIDLSTSCASFHALKADMVLSTLLSDIIRENYSAIQAAGNLPVVKRSTRVELYKRLAVAKEWIAENFSLAVSLQDSADIAMLSPEHFLRLFKRAYGMTPHHYLTAVRIDAACRLIRETNLDITNICAQTGFESLSSFSALFKQRKGLSPSQYRRS